MLKTIYSADTESKEEVCKEIVHSPLCKPFVKLQIKKFHIIKTLLVKKPAGALTVNIYFVMCFKAMFIRLTPWGRKIQILSKQTVSEGSSGVSSLMSIQILKILAAC